MEDNFRELIFKVANSIANPVRLTDRHKTLIDQNLTDFFAEFRTPNHPPYAAMILRAIEELKEKRGSSEESISKYIKGEYNDLPWAHNTLLKHHLGKLCDVGEVIVTRKQFYLLADATPILRNSSGRNEKLKRKRSSASGRIRSKRLRKDEIENDDPDWEEHIEVIERKHQSTGKCLEEIAKVQVAKKPCLLSGQENSCGLYAEEIQLGDQKLRKIKEKKQQLKQQNKVIEEHYQAGQLMCWREVACDDNDGENDFGNYSKVLPSESCETLFVGENGYLVEGEKQKMGSCGVGEVLPKQTYQASDLNMGMGQPNEEFISKASTPERPPGFALALADGFSQTKQQQSKDFDLLNACNFLSVTNHLDLPLNSTMLDKKGHMDSKMIEHENLWEFLHPGKSLETTIPPRTSSLSISLNPEAFELEQHDALSNENCPQVTAIEEPLFTVQEIEEQGKQLQLQHKEQKNSEFKKKMSNPEGSEEKHDQAKRIQLQAKGMRAPNGTLNSLKTDRQSLTELPNAEKSIFEEQKQPEEPLPQPGVVIALCCLPKDQKQLDHERQSYVSDCIRPIEFEQVVVDESSRNERRCRQLKRWNQTTLEHHDRPKNSRFRAKEVGIYEAKIGEDGKLDCLSAENVTKSKLRQIYPESEGKEKQVEVSGRQEEPIAGQRSKLRSWKGENMLEPNANIIVHSLHSPLALQLPQETKYQQKELSKILAQRSKLRSWKQENQFEQNTNAVASSCYSPHASLPSALPTPQKSEELEQVVKVYVAAKEKSQHKKSRPYESKPATSGNMRESFSSQNCNEEQKQPEHGSRGRPSKMKSTTTSVSKNLFKFSAVNLVGKSQKKGLRNAKMDQNQHGRGKPAVSTRGRPLKSKTRE